MAAKRMVSACDVYDVCDVVEENDSDSSDDSMPLPLRARAVKSGIIAHHIFATLPSRLIWHGTRLCMHEAFQCCILLGQL